MLYMRERKGNMRMDNKYIGLLGDIITWAIDFDGTLCVNEYPRIGEPHKATIAFFKDRKARGDKLILWTCREGVKLQKAVEWCEKLGLTFDAVNDNVVEWKQIFNNDTRKIGADYYCDDKNFMPWDSVSNVRIEERG